MASPETITVPIVSAHIFPITTFVVSVTVTGGDANPLRQHLQGDEKSDAGGRAIPPGQHPGPRAGTAAEERRPGDGQHPAARAVDGADRRDERRRSAFAGELGGRELGVGGGAKRRRRGGVEARVRVPGDGQLRTGGTESGAEPVGPAPAARSAGARTSPHLDELSRAVGRPAADYGGGGSGGGRRGVDGRAAIDPGGGGGGRRGGPAGEQGRQDAGDRGRRLRVLLAAVLRAVRRRAVLRRVPRQRSPAQRADVARIRQLARQPVHLRHLQPPLPTLLLAAHCRIIEVRAVEGCGSGSGVRN